MKKKIAFLLACLLLLSASVGCSQGENSDPQADRKPSEIGTEPGTFPIVNEKISLKIMVPFSASHAVPFNELEMIQEYEEKTNIHVEWDMVSEEAYPEKYKLVLASNNLPDAFGSGYSYDGAVVYKYGKEGIIIPLEDIINEVGVNTKKYFEEREDFRKLCTYPDGHIYALPQLDENQNIRVDSILYVNQTYLDALGMEHPQTLDEMEEYLRAVTSQDLNGDGQNEYGMSYAANQTLPNAITYLFGQFGVSWDTVTYMNQTLDGKGPFEFAPAMEETREALEYFHQWYQDGLIDPEVFTQNSQQLKAKGKMQGVGASICFWYLDLNDGDETQNEYRVNNMLQNEEGTAVWRRNGPMAGISLNQFMITNVNKYPYETLRYVDYWMDNGELALTNRFGPQGYSWDYIEDEEGNQRWTELATIPSGEVRTMENSTLKCTWGYGIPYWCFGDFWYEKLITAPNALERQDALNAPGSYMDHATVGLPNLVYEEEENKEALAIKSDLFKAAPHNC